MRPLKTETETKEKSAVKVLWQPCLFSPICEPVLPSFVFFDRALSEHFSDFYEGRPSILVGNMEHYVGAC